MDTCWRKKISTLFNLFIYLFPQEFKAHKLILSMSSPVFATMFHGELCEKGDTKILDITPEAFSSMLE